MTYEANRKPVLREPMTTMSRRRVPFTQETLALEAGVHPKVVSERLGHSTTQLTLDTYSHVSPHMPDRASESLASLIYGSAQAEPVRPVN